jgi:NTP pyrophosphatase (non-canonical NTP hydrolase)
MDSLDETLNQVLAFRNERDWAQFHTPKNLAALVAIEAAELQETMVWKSDDEVVKFINTSNGRAEVAEELADVLFATLLLCNTVGVDPISAIRDKLERNAEKYPSETVKGKAIQHPKQGSR